MKFNQVINRAAERNGWDLETKIAVANVVYETQTEETSVDDTIEYLKATDLIQEQ